PEPYLYQSRQCRLIDDYTDSIASGEARNARIKARALAPLRGLYNRWIMGPLLRGRPPNAALKHWAELAGLRCGSVRPPLSPLSEAEARELTQQWSAATARIV